MKFIRNLSNLSNLFFFVILVAAGLILVATRAIAFEYPIPELGFCRDQRECHLYCEVPRHKAACWSYSVYGTQDVLGDASPEDKVAALGITFPIPELGNCENIASCKTYCNGQVNQVACRSFADAHGLTKKEVVVELAQEELGCTSQEECRAFCDQELNQEICREFAKKYHLKGFIRSELFDRAKAELGCTNQDECRAVCELPENLSRCQAFAQKFNLGQTHKEALVERARQELGCTSFEDCRAFCQDPANSEKCRNFGSAVRDGVKHLIREKGDCATIEECRKACEANPGGCPNFPKRATDSGRLRLETGIKNRIETGTELRTEQNFRKTSPPPLPPFKIESNSVEPAPEQSDF